MTIANVMEHTNGRNLRRGQGRNGFTLIELLVTVAILSILAVMAAPSMETLILKNRLDSDVSEFGRGILLARSEAVKRSMEVRFEPIDPSDWGQGWQVIADGNRDGDYVDDPDDAPLYVGKALHPSLSAAKNSDYSLPSGFLGFNSLGAITTSTDKLSIAIKADNCRYGKMIQLSVNVVGNIEETETTCS